MTDKFNSLGSAVIHHADAMDCYASWPNPTTIMSDGPYGLGKFPGEPSTSDDLDEWYEPHVAEWSRHALPETTLWFWCSEIGWAETHPVMKRHGWKYKAAHVWNKGIGHVAGNCNSKTIRGFPIVTEMCIQYIRNIDLTAHDGTELPMKQWLRSEWKRSGLSLGMTNEACGVANAATRKYFTLDSNWYFPPPSKMMALAEYAAKHGNRTDRPYFSIDGKSPLTDRQWSMMRAKWNHEHGVTNVWDRPAVHDDERIKMHGSKSLHINQKPIDLIDRIVSASSDPGDNVWEPFGGLCPVAVHALRTGRHCCSSEINSDFHKVALQRMNQEIS